MRQPPAPAIPASQALAQLAQDAAAEGLTMQQLVDRLGERSSGLLVLLVGMLTFVPGAAIPFSLIVLLLGGGMVRGNTHPHLPARLGRMTLHPGMVQTALRHIAPLMRRAERWARPRLPALCRGRGLRLAGLAIVLNAVLIALPIPLGNTLPAIALIWLGIGLATGDGALVAAGLGMSLLALAGDALLVLAGIEIALLAL